jgi:hypothetical protein
MGNSGVRGLVTALAFASLSARNNVRVAAATSGKESGDKSPQSKNHAGQWPIGVRCPGDGRLNKKDRTLNSTETQEANSKAMSLWA